MKGASDNNYNIWLSHDSANLSLIIVINIPKTNNLKRTSGFFDRIDKCHCYMTIVIVMAIMTIIIMIITMVTIERHPLQL